MNISHIRFVLSNLKISGETVTLNLRSRFLGRYLVVWDPRLRIVV